ncbi:hypothetical protein [Roseateles sp.]|uniref:hypothetical protein n=1 Tax=Roseateles sp. TaxID=1971397 RepID=UPI003265D233
MDLNQRLYGQRNRYTQLLPLSYMVPTFYPSAPGNAQPQAGAPLIQLADPDLQSRAQRMVNALYWAAQTFANAPGMHDPSTLKVFIAPEFYFRCASPDEVHDHEFQRNTSFGSYPERARFELAEALYGAIQSSPLFADWVLVAGTVCSVLPPVDERMNLLNTAIMLRGQRAAADASVPYVLMEKHYISNIDGPPQGNHANLDPTTVFSFHLNPDQVLDNLIHWDGMTVGLEVCLDHALQVLVNAVNILQQSVGPDARQPDVQLVTSCGMNVVPYSVAVQDGGLVLLTDGMSHVADHLPEPPFYVGRYTEATMSVQFLNKLTDFQFQELPRTDDYQVNYFHGLYAANGSRQGIWCGKQPQPMLVKPGTRAQPATAPGAGQPTSLIPAVQVVGSC